MNASSSSSVDSSGSSIQPTVAGPHPVPPIGELLQSLFVLSQSHDEFVRRVVHQIQNEFDAGIVAVDFGESNQPCMLITDETLGQQVSRRAIHEALAVAAKTPTACDVALNEPGDGTESIANSLSTRGYRVELQASPDRLAIVIVHKLDDQPDAGKQLATLKLLSQYVEAMPVQKNAIGDNDSNLEDKTGQSPADQATTNQDSEKLVAEQIPLEDAPASTAITAFHQSIRHLHRDLQLSPTAYRVANESQNHLNCDRVSVLLVRRGKLVMHAISGVTTINRQSNAVQCSEAFARAATILDRPMLLPCGSDLPPQVQGPLDNYLDETGITTVILLPLFSPDDHESDIDSVDSSANGRCLIGAILIEYFAGDMPTKIMPAMTAFADDASFALYNAMQHEGIFGISLWRLLGKLKQTKIQFWVAAIATALISLIIAANVIQVDHFVIATGSVQPVERRQVFSAVDGVVKTLHVTDGEKVAKGDLLLEIENADLQSKAEQIAGEIQTMLQRIASSKAVRLSDNKRGRNEPRGSTALSSSGRMAVEEQQYESQLANLREQQAVIRAQQDELGVVSPIDGSVVGWQLEQRLASRPVSRGNLLLSVADERGAWELRLNIKDTDTGVVLDAIDDSAQEDESLDVRFAVATQPDRSYRASLIRIATATRLSEADQGVVDAVAHVALSPSDGLSDHEGLDRFDHADVRIGADVTARIYCGRRSLLRSWFSDVFDFVDRNVLFYLR